MTLLNYLNLQIRLLIAEFGFDKVVRELSEINEVSLDEIQKQITELHNKNSKKRKQFQQPDIHSILKAVIEKNPQRKDSLEKIGLAFINRTFLPHLRNVNTFLERNGHLKKYKLRNQAFKDFIEVINELPDNKLNELLSLIDKPVDQQSGFLMLANEILGHGKKQREGEL